MGEGHQNGGRVSGDASSSSPGDLSGERRLAGSSTKLQGPSGPALRRLPRQPSALLSPDPAH